MSKVEITIPVDDMTEEAFRAELLKMINKLETNTTLRAYALIRKYTTMAKKRFQDIVTSSVKAYYDDYRPITYKRQYSLYDAFNVNVTTDHWYVDVDPEIYKSNNDVHGDLSDYIYEYMFVEGYHGGAAYGDNHPEPGVPWWIFPSGSNGMANWMAPAPQTIPSPYEMIVGGVEDAADELLDEYGNELYDKINGSYDHIIDFINKYMGVK